MLQQETKTLQDTRKIPVQKSVAKAEVQQPEANETSALAAPNASVVLKVLARAEFLLSPYNQKQGQEPIPKAPYYLVVITENGQKNTPDALNNPCIPLIVDAVDPSKKTAMTLPTPEGQLCFKVSPKGHIALLSAPPTLRLALSTPGVVSHEGHYKSAALTVTAKSFVNKGALFVDELRLYCKIVNRGEIVARKATFKRMPGNAETLTLDNTDGVIDIQKRLVLQQGRIKNIHGKCFAETLRCETTGALNNQHGWIQVRKRARLDLRGGLRNSHGAIIQHLGQADNVKPDSTGIWIQTRDNIRCTDGGAISAVQGTVDITSPIPGSRLEGTQKKIIVDDTSRVGGTTATNIVGFNQARFSTPVRGNVVKINSDAVQLWRGVCAENSATITQPEGTLRVEDIWKGGDFSVHSERFDNKGTLDLQNLSVHADDIELLGVSNINKDLRLYPERRRRLADSTGMAAHRLRAGRITIHLPQGETITEVYTALGSLSYHLAPTATQPLVFLANQTSLQGDFSVESPVPVKLGDTTHFVTLKTEQGHVSVKAPSFDVEQGGIVSLNSFIEAPGGFTLGRLVEDPTRQVFATVYAHAQSSGSSSLGEHVFRSYKFLGNDIRTNRFYYRGHLFVLPIATTNGSFLHIKDSCQILGSFQHRGALTTHDLTIHSPEPSIWEASRTEVTGNCTLTGNFTLKRTTSILTAGYYMCQRTVFKDNIPYSFCNSDPASLTAQGELLGNAVVNAEASILHATKKAPTITVNTQNFSAACYQKFIGGTLQERRALRDSHQPLSGGLFGYRGQWVGVVRRFPGYPANVACPSNYINDYSGCLPYAVGFLVKTHNFIGAQKVFPAQFSCVSEAVLPNVRHLQGYCSARAMLLSLDAGPVVLGSHNLYIPPQRPSPVLNLMKDPFNSGVTYVNQDLKATLAQNQTDQFHFMVRELFWFDDAHAQAFYRDIAEHLFVVSPDGIERVEPRAVLSLSPKLLIERVQKATQKALMRGYIFEGEVIDERLVQQMHRNATEYLKRLDKKTLKDFLREKMPLKAAPTKPFIYYESIINEQGVEVLQPYPCIPPALINEVQAQRRGLFRSGLFLAFSNKFAPKQLIDRTQRNPAMQSQITAFFCAHPEEREFLEDHAAATLAAVAALENKMNAESLARLESKHDAEHPVAVPEQALAVRDNQRHRSSVTLLGHFNVGAFAVVAEGNVSLVAANIKAQHVLLASLLGNVIFKAIVERFGNSENFHDVLRRADIVAKGLLQIMAGKDVIFEAAHTQSGLGTYVEALGNILDMPVQLVYQQVQHFYERRRSGTIINTDTTQVPSIHQTDAHYEAHAGGSVTLYGTKFKAKNVTLAAAKNTHIFPVISCSQQTSSITDKSRSGLGSRTKTTQSVWMQQTAIPAQFNVQNSVTIKSGKKFSGFMNSSALQNHFSGEVVHLMQGVNRACSATQTSSRDVFWQKSRSETMQQVTYTESNMSGSIVIQAKRVILDQVRGKPLAFRKNIKPNNAVISYQILDPQYVHDSKTIQGPSQGLVIVVSLGVGIVSFGQGETIANSAFVKTTLGITAKAATAAIAAGFSALCSQAAVSLLQNEGNPLKATQSLASVDTAKSLAIAMISAGVMHEICDALKLPGLGGEKSLLEHAQYNFARAGVNVALNMGINQQSPGDALRAGLIDAAVGTAAGFAAQEIGGLRRDGHINYVNHKLLHGALGAVGGCVLAGSKGAVAGAMGAMVAEGVADACAPKARDFKTQKEYDTYKKQRLQAANIAKFAAATTALVASQNVGTAVATATYAVENNFLNSGKLPESAFRGSDADALESKDEADNAVDDSQFMRERARERTAESMTFKLDSRRDSRMPRNGWERLAEDRGSFRRINTPNEALSKAELTPYTAPWFKRFATALLGDNSPATQRWQTSNQKLMAKEKVFIDAFTSRQHERFSTPSLLPASHQNPYVEGGLRTCRALGRAMDNIGDGLLHLDRMAIGTGVLMWDASGAVAKITFGVSTEGSQLRNDARIKTVTYEFNRFMKADIGQKLDMITEIGATFVVGGGLTRLPGNLTRNMALPKPSPVRRIETTLMRATESKNLSEGMFTLYHSSKRTQASLATRAEAFSEVAMVQKSLQSSNATRRLGQPGSTSLKFRAINANETIVPAQNQPFGQTAWQNFKTSTREQIRITGGRSTADMVFGEERLAAERYSEIRNATQDIQKIAKNLGIPEFQVRRVKEHLFYNTHQLDHGLGIRRFHPDLEIAIAWERLEIGSYTKSDLLVFKHEHFEARFEGIFKTDYRTAHDAASINHPSGLKNTRRIDFKKRGNKKWDY